MAKTTVNWDSTETWQRVVASILATGVKVDLKQAALHFGTTYDTLENRFRKIKKQAEDLKNEVENGEREVITAPSRNKSATVTPRKPKTTPKKDALGTVANGRISKPTTPKSKKVKKEIEEDCFQGLDDLSNSDGFPFTQSFGMGYDTSFGDNEMV